MQLLIDLPPREEQIAFNRKRWREVLADRELARWPGRVETNAFGNILMMPPATGGHSARQGKILLQLHALLGGRSLPECPVSTIDGVRAVDVGWYSEERFARVVGQDVFEVAPEICVEILSPDNTEREMAAKKRLYFEAGAEEVWLCRRNGQMEYFLESQPEEPAPRSTRCPGFPSAVE